MEVCSHSHINFQVNDVKNLHGLYKDTSFESSYELMGGFSVEEAAKFLDIQDDIEEEVSGSNDNGVLQKKPVSAMKGSREKRGVSPGKKLSVKWAPDVYDPVVPRSSVQQMVITSRPRKHGKKSPNSNSSSSSKGSKGKDKKKGRKRGGFS